jgi:hypothetical protein
MKPILKRQPARHYEQPDPVDAPRKLSRDEQLGEEGQVGTDEPAESSAEKEEKTLPEAREQIAANLPGSNDAPKTTARIKPIIPPKPTGSKLGPSPKSRAPKTATARRAPMVAPGDIDLAALSKAKSISVSKHLKGDATKISCLLNVDGVTYVLKAGLGNGYIIDHLINTGVFRDLALPGVKAPFVQRLTPEFRRVLTARLNPNDPQDKVILDALGQNDQLATTAPGHTVEAILDRSNDQVMQTLTGLVQGKSKEEAVTALVAALLPPQNAQNANPNPKPGPTVLKGADLNKARPLLQKLLDDSASRPQTCQDLLNQVVSPKNLAMVSLVVDVVNQGSGPAAQKVTDRINDLVSASTVLSARIKTKEGASALGGVATADLLLGMNDRFLGYWNGGNFMFDPTPTKQDLWCVDNAKNEDKGLSAADDTAWTRFVILTMSNNGKEVGNSLGGQLHFKIYERPESAFAKDVPLQPNEKISTTNWVTSSVDDTLDKMQSLADGVTASELTTAQRNKLSGRIAVLKTRQTFDNLLTFDPSFQTVPATAKPALGTKATRLIKTQTPATKRAETIKNQVRTQDLSDAQLAALENEVTALSTGPQAGDRRFTKTLFTIRFARLLKYLDKTAVDLGALAHSQNKPWGPITQDTIKKLVDGTAPWQTTLNQLNDKQSQKNLQDALDALTQAALSLNPQT